MRQQHKPQGAPQRCVFDCHYGNMVFVDKVHGDNADARREDPCKPFSSLTAARAAAKNGDTIVVRPGTYTTTGGLGATMDSVTKIQWHFENGTFVNYTETLFSVPDGFELRISGEGNFYGSKDFIVGSGFSRVGGFSSRCQDPAYHRLCDPYCHYRHLQSSLFHGCHFKHHVSGRLGSGSGNAGGQLHCGLRKHIQA